MSAKVTSIAAVREFKAALQVFEQEAAASLETIQMQIYRALDWVEHEQPAYWNTQVKLAFDEVAKARTQLSTCQMRTVAGRRPSCIEEKQAYEKAKRRVAHCQRMVEQVKRWAIKVRHEADEYRGRTAGLTRCIETELPRMTALIERTASALEHYAEVGSVAEEPQSPTEPPAAAQEP